MILELTLTNGEKALVRVNVTTLGEARDALNGLGPFIAVHDKNNPMSPKRLINVNQVIEAVIHNELRKKK